MFIIFKQSVISIKEVIFTEIGDSFDKENEMISFFKENKKRKT